MKLLITQFSPSSRYFLLGPNISLNTLFSNTLSLPSSRNVTIQVLQSYKATSKVKLSLCFFN